MSRSRLARRRAGALLAGIAVAMPVSYAAAQTPDRTVTLDEAVDLALANSPALIQRMGAIASAEWGERSAWGAFLPSLAMNSGATLASATRYDANTGVNVTGSSDSYSASLSASMPIFTAGRRGAQLRQAQAETATAEAAVREQRFTTMLAAKSAFFEVLRAEELIRVRQAQIGRARKGLDAAQARLEAGSATRSDSLRGRLEVNQAQQALLQAQSQLRSARYALGATIGIDGPAGVVPPTDLEPRPIAHTEDELIAIAIESAPAVVTAGANLKSNQAALRVSRTQYFPTINSSAGYSWNNQDLAFGGGRTSWNTRLSFSYNLFNGFTREEANQRAAVNLRSAEASLDDVRRRIRANVVTTADAVRVAEQRMRLTQEALAVAEEDLRVQEERYRLGASTILEQIQSQIALAQAESDMINARFDYLIAHAQLESLVGRDL